MVTSNLTFSKGQAEDTHSSVKTQAFRWLRNLSVPKFPILVYAVFFYARY